MKSEIEKLKLKKKIQDDDEPSNSSNKILKINENDIIMINSINNNNNNEISINLMKDENNSIIQKSKSYIFQNQCNYLIENKNVLHKRPYIFCQKCEIVFCSNCLNYHLRIGNQNHKNIDNQNVFIREENIDKQNEQILKDIEIFKKNNLDDYLYLEVELKNEIDSLTDNKNKIINIFDNLDKEYQKQLNLLQKASSTQKDKIDNKALKIENTINNIKKYDKSNKLELNKYFKESISLNIDFQKDKKKISDFLKNIPKKIINNINRNIVKHKKDSFNEISNIISNNTPKIINSDVLSEINLLEMSNNFSCPSLPNSGFLLDNINTNANNDKTFLGQKRKAPNNKNIFQKIQKENSFSITHIENSKDKMDKKIIEQLKKVLLHNFSNMNRDYGDKNKNNNIINKRNFGDNSSISSTEQENILNKLKNDKNISQSTRPGYSEAGKKSVIKSSINMLNNINIINNNNNKIIVDDENFIDFQKDKNNIEENHNINGLENLMKENEINKNIENKLNNNNINSVITLSVESQEQESDNNKMEEAKENQILSSEEIEQAVRTINEIKDEKIYYLFSLSKSDLFSIDENDYYDSLFFYNSKDKIVRKIKLLKDKFTKNDYPKKYFKTLIINNTYFITGGKNFENNTINNVYQIKYDPTKDYAKIIVLPKMLYLRQNHNVVYLPYYNYIVVCGGLNLRTTEFIDLDDLPSYEKENQENEDHDFSKFNKSKFKWKTIDKNLNKSICDAVIFVLNNTMIFIVGGYDNEKGLITNEIEMFDFKEKRMAKSNKKWRLIKLNKNEYNYFDDIFMGGLYIDKNEVMIFGGKNIEKKHNIKLFRVDQDDNENVSQNGDEVKISITNKNNCFLEENKFKFEYIQFFNDNMDSFFEFNNYQNDTENKCAACLLPNGDILKYDIKKEHFFLKKFGESN